MQRAFQAEEIVNTQALVWREWREEQEMGVTEIWGVICDVSMNEHRNYLMKTSI